MSRVAGSDPPRLDDDDAAAESVERVGPRSLPTPLDADAIATASRVEAYGASVADLLADGNVDTAVALAMLAGDQS